jgi:hypothetical protein
MKRKISCDMGQRMQLETTTSLKRNEKHRDTKTQRHKGTHHAFYCALLCLCVSLCLCVFAEKSLHPKHRLSKRPFLIDPLNLTVEARTFG